MFRNKNWLMLVLLAALGAGIYGCEANSSSDGDGGNGGNNPNPNINDQDMDGIEDGDDNCPAFANHDQNDMDGDGVGDACDDDIDGDDVSNDDDNCPWVANEGQTDTDDDGIGDACDDNVDTDDDGYDDGIDNCPDDVNHSQTDTDRDGIGDACDDDRDGDGREDGDDNCPFAANYDQEDSNADGEGDVCEGDQDVDGIPDEEDNCPFVPNPDQEDLDGDGVGDVCDDDDDGDGVTDGKDECPREFGEGENGCPVDEPPPPEECENDPEATEDSDGDGVPDACDDDGFTCNADTTYQPLLAGDNFEASGDSLGVCLGCSVFDAENTIDGTDASYATMNIGLALVYGGAEIRATASDPADDFTDIDRIGFVVSDPASQLLNLTLLGEFLTLRFYNDGEEVDSAVVGGGLLDLELLGMNLEDGQRFLSTEVNTDDLQFDEIQLDYAGAINANDTLRVHRVCAGNDPQEDEALP